MNDHPPPKPQPPDAASPAEARLHDLLEIIRAQPPRERAQLTADVLRKARLERRIRAATITATQLGAAALEGLVVLLGLSLDPPCAVV